MTDPAFDPIPGLAEFLEPGLQRILAPNPSPMTFRGTNTYVIGERDVAVIDPGPAIPEHLDAILSAVGAARRVSHIFVTHAHLDHSALAPGLSKATGAPVLAFGRAEDGRSATMQALARQTPVGGGEGVDQNFLPDIFLADGDSIKGDGWTIDCLWTPGHMANHMSFSWAGAVFTGDIIMGWATSLVSPPDGDLAAFMASCRRLSARQDRVFFPGHGDPITDPQARSRWLIAHRQQREAQILDTLRRGAATPARLTRTIYVDVPWTLLPAAERNVLAHLIALHERGFVTAIPVLGPDATFHVRAVGKRS